MVDEETKTQALFTLLVGMRVRNSPQGEQSGVMTKLKVRIPHDPEFTTSCIS